MSYEIVIVETKDQFDKLYKSSALTIEGISESNIVKFVEWMELNDKALVDVVFIIKGKTMNSTYLLRGANAYDDEIHIVSIIPKDHLAVTLPRLGIGARWFDDIVDNNIKRESELISKVKS